MSIAFNSTDQSFEDVVNAAIYVDKTGLLSYLNKVINTPQKFVFVSRPRRFGKTFAAQMINSYYSKGCDSRHIFDNLFFSGDSSYPKYLNEYDVIFLDIKYFWFLSEKNSLQTIKVIQDTVISEIFSFYPEYEAFFEKGKDDLSLSWVLLKINSETKKRFIFVIDEWDCIFREDKDNAAGQKAYIDFLSGLFKGATAERTIALAYMTGILPIKKYGTHSALNNFDEFTMVSPGPFADYSGFTEEEVKALCETYDMDFGSMKKWYDGYCFSEKQHVYSPKSVLDAIRFKRFDNYWTQTESYEVLKEYICMNFDGIKDSVAAMLSGLPVPCNIESFKNDMEPKSVDNVLTLLVHLGYLSYNFKTKEVHIPNKEVRGEFLTSINDAASDWSGVISAINISNRLLEATINRDEESVAAIIEDVHMENVSILKYNDENALSCVIALAYYSARKDYVLFRELACGKGFADIVFFPKQTSDKPLLLVELKWDKDAKSAISQIHEKEYPALFNQYKGKILLVGISYGIKNKKHVCVIEELSLN